MSVTDTKEKEILDTGLSLYHDSGAIVEGFHGRTASFEKHRNFEGYFLFFILFLVNQSGR